MARTTTGSASSAFDAIVIRIAAVSQDSRLRHQLSKAFDRCPSEWDVTLHETPPTDVDVVIAAPDVSVEGAIAFDPDHPDEAIDEIETAFASRTKQLIWVAGARGGCGVTTVALHLAALAGADSCVVETPGAGVADRLGFEPGYLDWREPDIDLAALSVPTGFRVLLAPRDGQSMDVPDVIERARQRFDHVIVDGGTASDIPRELDAYVLVTSPTVPAARRAGSLLVSHNDHPWAVIANRTGGGGETSRSELQTLIGRRITLELPHTPALRDVEDDGRLLVSERHRWVRRMRLLWNALKPC